MCDTVFAFSQRGGHFLQCPSQKETTRLPAKLASLLTARHLQQVHHVELGFEDSFLITWTDKEGRDHIDSQGLPQELREFIYAQNAQKGLVRNIRSIRCTLGPYNASFFAHDGSAYRWMNLPSGLLSALESRIMRGEWSDRPRIVALGANNNFVLLTEKNAAVWNLGNYQTASKMLDYASQQSNGVNDIRSLSLHAYRYDGFVSQSRNGTVIHNALPPHATSSLQIMTQAILKDTQAATKKPVVRRDNEQKDTSQTRPSNLQQRAQLRKDWGDHAQHFTAQARGIKLSLSMSVSAGGIAKLFG